MDILQAVLRLVHIVSGCIWVGVGVFLPFFLIPSVEELGPEGGKLMGALQRRGMMTYLPLIAIMTILSGAWLIWRDSAGQIGPFLTSRFGMTLGIGAAAAIIAWGLGMAITRPNMMKVGAAMQSLPSITNADERSKIMANVAALRASSNQASRIGAILLIVAAAAMATARYM